MNQARRPVVGKLGRARTPAGYTPPRGGASTPTRVEDGPGGPSPRDQPLAALRCGATSAGSWTFFGFTRRVGHDATQVAQEGRALEGALHEHAAAVHRVDLAAGQVELAEPVERAGDRRLRHVQVGRQAADRVRAVLQVAGQEHAELAGGKIRPVPAHERHDGVPKDADQLVGGRGACHGCSPFQVAWSVRLFRVEQPVSTLCWA